MPPSPEARTVHCAAVGRTTTFPARLLAFDVAACAAAPCKSRRVILTSTTSLCSNWDHAMLMLGLCQIINKRGVNLFD